MQSRLRSPGEGVRTNSAAIGLGSGRLSEGSIQGHGVYNSDYRSFNRGFGRGSPKPYPPPPQPPRRGDIFMEAGRLAAEYLVSQGMLPPNSLPNKWQNGKFQDFRGQDRESLPPPSKGRTSVLARLGNLDADAGSGRRRFVDEFGQVGLRNHSRGRRRTGSSRGYGSDWGRENGRTGSWSEKARGLSDSNDTDDDVIGGYRGELRSGFDANDRSRRTSAEKIPSKSENVGSEPDLESNEPHGDADSKEKNSNIMKEIFIETDTVFHEVLDDDGGMPLEAGEVNYSISEDKMEEKIEEMENLDKLTSSVELDKQPTSVELDRQMNSMDLDKKPNLLEDDQVSESDTGLLLKCNFGEVLSNTPFSMTLNVSKVEEYPTNEEKTKSDIDPSRENNASIEGASVEVSSNDPLKNRPPSPKCLTPDISRVRSIQYIYEPGDFGSAFVVERESDKRSQSFSNRFSGIHQHESNQESLASGSTSMATLGEEEGFNQPLAAGEVGTKRPREWDKDSDESFHMQNFIVKKSAMLVDRVATEEGIVDAIDQGNLDALFSKVRAQPGLDSREEKQLLSGSFKICDLNLMEASEIPESPNDVSIPSSTAGVMNDMSVDVDLSIISKSFNCTDRYTGPSSDTKEILIVDVPDDDDPVMEDKSNITSAGKAETIYSSLGNFLSHADHNVHIQDSYGLTISEFPDITSCSTIPADSNHTQGDLTIPNEEVIHGGDDDPIYISLEEIPIGQLLMDDHPTLFWTPCAAHCIDLMLHDICKPPIITTTVKRAIALNGYIYNHPYVLNMMRTFTEQKELIRPGVTRFATVFLTLQSIYNQKNKLRRMFTSEEWSTSRYHRDTKGKDAYETVMSIGFWNNIQYSLRATGPLVRVLRLVDSEKKPAMGYIYEAMDRAKEAISKSFNYNEAKYYEIWEIIDKRWNDQLHRPLHAAGYYLNPEYFYTTPRIESNEELNQGFLDTVARLVPDEAIQHLVETELSLYRYARGVMGSPNAIRNRALWSPADWWIRYGCSAPHLQELAVKVLSLTCCLSGCERNWSAFEHIHSKRRNRLEHKRLNDLVYVRYNQILHHRYKKRDSIDPISLKDIDDSNEWLTGQMESLDLDEGGDGTGAPDLVFPGEDLDWAMVSEAAGVDEPQARTRAKGKAPASTSNVYQRRGRARQAQVEEEEEEDVDVDEDEEEEEEEEEEFVCDDNDSDDYPEEDATYDNDSP